MQYVWQYFLELDSARGSNGFGLNPISWSDILAFFTLMGFEPTDWEVQAIRRIDNLRLKQVAEDVSKASKNKPSK